ncbi:DNA-directed DNA polymerase II small subunit [Candidatus Woesearchaeota archaeon]|nr:DNA-directed DNA polymerase II small subunit [Candidatus Woesearchaeota archaeon]
MEQDNIKKDIVLRFLEKGILISPDFFDGIEENFNFDDLYSFLSEKIVLSKFLIFTNEINKLLKNLPDDVNWVEFDNTRVAFEKEKNSQLYDKFVQYLKNAKKEEKKIEVNDSLNSVNVLFSYEEESKKREIQDFVSYFNVRYKSIEKILQHRQELQNILSINRIIGKKEKENISLIGIVKEKQTTANGNIMLELEDITSSIKVLISKNKPDLFNLVKDVVLDEVVGIVGVNGDNIVFANNVIWPEVPLNKEFKKSPDECYAVVISDIHVGSDMFLLDKFNNFLKWINGGMGNEKQKDIASKVKYIIIVGDLVDGVGIYPEQDKELVIKDIYQQYEECAKLLKQIPSHIKLIISPGNHDAMRIAEPQPVLYQDFTKSIWNLPNAIMVSNPAIINIHSSNSFSGFNLLLYHGYSFDYYVANVESIRNGGGYDRADLIMKFLLQRRHLAPTHTSTLYIPDVKKDSLVIEQVPDFFIAGHIHKSCVANYRIFTMICGSCWQAKTPFQEKVGHNPEPARVPIINLQTREVKLLRF